MTSAAASRPPALVCGVPIANATMAEAVDAIGDMIERGRADGRSRQVATVNVDFLVKAAREPALLALLQDADLNLADGAPVVWAARALGMPVVERVAGADLVPALAERAATTGWRIHLYGSAPGTAERAADLLTERHPGLTISGDSGGIIKDVTDVDDDVIASIRDRDPDILCVALGNPKQERFIQANRHRLNARVLIGIGGTLDMLVGSKRRAPLWVQRSGLEWVVRLGQEPRRLLGRYALDAWVYPPAVARQWRAARRLDAAWSTVIEAAPDVVVVRAAQRPASSAGFADAVAMLEGGAALRIELAGVPSLAIADVAVVVGLIRHARLVGAPAISGVASAELERELGSIGVNTFLTGLAPNS